MKANKKISKNEIYEDLSITATVEPLTDSKKGIKFKPSLPNKRNLFNLRKSPLTSNSQRKKEKETASSQYQLTVPNEERDSQFGQTMNYRKRTENTPKNLTKGSFNKTKPVAQSIEAKSKSQFEIRKGTEEVRSENKLPLL